MSANSIPPFQQGARAFPPAPLVRFPRTLRPSCPGLLFFRQDGSESKDIKLSLATTANRCQEMASTTNNVNSVCRTGPFPNRVFVVSATYHRHSMMTSRDATGERIATPRNPVSGEPQLNLRTRRHAMIPVCPWPPVRQRRSSCPSPPGWPG
jgi:hypothetical protein